MAEHLCCVCPRLRPHGEPRYYLRRFVCDGCRARLHNLLADIAETYAQLDPAGELVNSGEWVGEPWTDRNNIKRRDHRDPVAANLPAGPLSARMPGSSSGPAEPRIPGHLDVLDLTLPAHVAALSHQADPPVGHLPAATVLDSWCRDWQAYGQSETLPAPTVDLLCRWLDLRLDWACEHHPAIDEFAGEIANLDRVIRVVARLNPAPAETKDGVPCRQCGMLALYQWTGSERIECGACPALYTVGEYLEWAQLVAGWILTPKRKRVGAASAHVE